MELSSSIVVGHIGVLARSDGWLSDGFRWCDVQHQHHLITYDGFTLEPGENGMSSTTNKFE